MKKIVLMAFLLLAGFGYSQSKSVWKKSEINLLKKVKEDQLELPMSETFSLNLLELKKILKEAPHISNSNSGNFLVIPFPNDAGEFERFRIFESPVLHPDLEAKYPDIKSYAGQGIDDPSARIRFSVSPLGLQSMRMSATKPTTFIEPYTDDLSEYTVYKRADKEPIKSDFECEVTSKINQTFYGVNTQKNANDGILRTYRLAVSTTGEYTAYHGGTKAGALAAINTTMTRVNGIFENDFNVTMVLIADTDDVIYTNSNTDPYSNGSFNSQLQSTLTSNIGEANYDIGHLFAKASNNGNAGCIGCVCVDGSKGSAFTSRDNPVGDLFDVDFVAHEMGHQFGGNHTWTFNGNEGRNAQMEPGSGTTIMGYAGITGATDVQPNSDPYFHARSIEQITDYIKTTNCQTNTNTGNAVPTANAGSNYTIPKGTPFVLTGVGSDSNASDVLTYCWEQYDENDAAHTNPTVTKTSGVAFRSYNPTTSPDRYFPRLSTIKSGATSWQWEAVPNVARLLNFRLTVRDNRAGGANNNSDDMRVTVNGTAGPFVVNSPNTNVNWSAGSTQIVTWNVAGTTGNGVNAANVDIFLSTDGGDTYPISVASNVTNDGSHSITVPNSPGSQNRIMVRGSNNIFFDISNTNFTISGQVACNATVPSGLAVSGVTDSNASLSWNSVTSASYDFRYRAVGSSSWISNNQNATTNNVSGLSASTQYEAQVRSNCGSVSVSNYSSLITFTTTAVQLNYCNSNGNSVTDEYISRVQLGTIDNASTGTAGGYADYTGFSTDLTKNSSATITVTPTWTGTLYNEAYAVWIDYNLDGDFNDANELVWSQNPTQNTPVTGSFTVPATATEGITRMRVSMKYNALPTPCESFPYGEVEDYSVNIINGVQDTTVPIITLVGNTNITVTEGDTYSDQGATALDNIDGDITADIVVGGSVDTASAGTYIITYNVSDNAGNAAVEVVRTIIVEAAVATCANEITTYPYTESFENTLGQWTQNTDDDIDWTLLSGSTLSSNTGPSAANDGTHYIYVEASGSNYPSKQAILTSPCFNLTQETTANLSFDYHMYGAANLGDVLLEVSNDNGASWSVIWNKSGNQGNSWITENVNLSQYAGQIIQMRFNRTTGATWQGDFAVDKLNITTEDVSVCANVSLSITFDDYPEETSWEVLNTSGTAIASGNSYGSQADGSTLLIDLGCIEEGCYDFVFKDSYGDGICCSYGNGSYTLTNTDTNLVLASGDQFTSTQTTNFCIGGASADRGVVDTIDDKGFYLDIYPNPVMGDVVKIDVSTDPLLTYTITNTLGQTVSIGKVNNSNTINVSELDSGMYILKFTINEKKTLTKKFIKR